MRAPTPSAAAELIAPDRAVVSRHVSGLQTQLTVLASRAAVQRAEEVEAHRLQLARSLPAVEVLAERVRDRAAAASRAMRAQAEHATARVEGHLARLQALSPLATLERGYAMVVRADGSIAASAGTLADGELVTVRLRDGARGARIEEQG